MINSLKSLYFAAAGIVAVSSGSAATTLLASDFTGGSTANWSEYSPNGAGGTFNATGDALNYTPGGATVLSGMRGAFSNTQLQIGDIITVTLDLRYTALPASPSSSLLRIALGDVIGSGNIADTGFRVNAAVGASSVSGGGMVYDDGAGSGSGLLGGTNPAQTITTPGIADLNTHSISLSVAREATQYILTYSVDGNLVSQAFEMANAVNFDSFVIGSNGTPADFQPFVVDNVNVSVVPEPSVAILGGMGALALLRRRRN